MITSRRGLAALGAALLLAACAPAPEPAETPPPAAAKPEVRPVIPEGAVGPAPAGFEALEIVTPQGRTRFFVEIADDEAERERGLMFRESLAPDRGMLFDFKTPQPVAFWMKNTLIPLDILYVQADGTVLSIARNATPRSEVPMPSGGPIRGALEIAGGRAEQIGVLPGDKVAHRIFQP
jgi:uncharacterized membrane protein (UPF0127 family)